MVRRLHIGGTVRADGWEILNVVPGPHVDYVGDASDLSRFSEGAFNDIYASHVLEHFDYRQVLLSTLKEWNRVLKPFGRLYISVPDLDVLARLFLDNRLSIDERFHVMRMMFGGHVDAFDFHLVGLNRDFLQGYLQEAGFGHITQFDELGLFPDTSAIRFKGELISLNLIAKKM